MNYRIILFLCLSSIMLLNNCGKQSKRKFTTITVKYQTNIPQLQCSGGSDAFLCVYFDIIDPNAGRVSRSAIYDLQSSGVLELEMGPQSNPHYCSGSQGECTEKDRIHYQVGKTYQYKAYLVCNCSFNGECGSNFEYLEIGVNKPVKLLTSGTIKLERKEEKNVIQVVLSN